MDNNISYFGINDKTFEILFSIIHAKYRSETATKSDKIKYIIKQMMYRYQNLCEQTIDDLTDVVDTFLCDNPDLQSYLELQKMSKEYTPQQLYDFCTS